jgi:hypothetical protein
VRSFDVIWLLLYSILKLEGAESEETQRTSWLKNAVHLAMQHACERYGARRLT